LVWGDFVPRGPTLHCAGLADTEDTTRQEVFYRCLHPRGDRSLLLGQVPSGGPDRLAMFCHLLESGFRQAPSPGYGSRWVPMVRGVPNLVSVRLPEAWADVILQLFSVAPAFRDADWGREIHLLNHYGPALFERARDWPMVSLDTAWVAEGGCRKSLTTQRLTSRGRPSERWPGSATAPYESSWYDAQTGVHWWEEVNRPSYRGLALVDFAQAWVAANGDAADARRVQTSFEDLRDFFSRFDHELWPRNWTTGALQESLGP
jgi:hypothetical protein